MLYKKYIDTLFGVIKMPISKTRSRIYVMFGQVSAYMLVTLIYYSMLKHIAQNDYYLTAILSSATGAIWGAGITNMLNTLRTIRQTKEKEFLSDDYQNILHRYEAFFIISISLLFIFVLIIGIFKL